MEQSNDLLQIANEIKNKYKFECDIKKCDKLTRHYREREKK